MWRRVSFLLFLATLAPLGAGDPLYDIELITARQGFDGQRCWVHARAGIIPPGGPGNPGKDVLAVMTLQPLDLRGSDVFGGIHSLLSRDGGRTWGEPIPHPRFERRPFSWKGREDYEITVCDFWPQWHAASGTLLGIGHSVVYENNVVAKVRPRGSAYAVFDPAAQQWSPWQLLELPDEPRFENAGAGCVQRVDLEDGTLLLPIYFKEPGEVAYSTTVLRCAFDGTTLRYLGHGDVLHLPIKRGFCEPSLVRWGGRFFLTLRNDERGYVAVSEDGSHFSEPVPWAFEDGEDLGNYNTQQHWVAHREALFLVYNRRGANNDHVARHRAPLFIARVDPETLRVQRDSEQVLVPEHGARLGNFGVTVVDETESWVTVTEWMQGPGPNYHDPAPLVARGADNRVWVAKLKWKRPNDPPR